MTSTQKCKRNKWKIGTTIKCSTMERGCYFHDYYEITAIGKFEVLGIEIKANPKLSKEIIIPFDDYNYIRKTK